MQVDRVLGKELSQVHGMSWVRVLRRVT